VASFWNTVYIHLLIYSFIYCEPEGTKFKTFPLVRKPSKDVVHTLHNPPIKITPISLLHKHLAV